MRSLLLGLASLAVLALACNDAPTQFRLHVGGHRGVHVGIGGGFGLHRGGGFRYVNRFAPLGANYGYGGYNTLAFSSFAYAPAMQSFGYAQAAYTAPVQSFGIVQQQAVQYVPQTQYVPQVTTQQFAAPLAAPACTGFNAAVGVQQPYGMGFQRGFSVGGSGCNCGR